jgi:hypothetical protein
MTKDQGPSIQSAKLKVQNAKTAKPNDCRGLGFGNSLALGELGPWTFGWWQVGWL